MGHSTSEGTLGHVLRGYIGIRRFAANANVKRKLVWFIIGV